MFVIEETNIIFNSANILPMHEITAKTNKAISYWKTDILYIMILDNTKKLNNLLGISKNYVYGKDIIQSNTKEK
jgi:hypothetical protein